MPQSPPPAQPSRLPLPGGGNAPLLLAMLVFLVTSLVTFSAWTSARLTAEAQLLRTFDYRTRDMVFSIGRRMAVYEQVLRGARGYLRGSVELDRSAWAEYYGLQRLDQSFPGMEALGIATIIPPARLAAHQAAIRRQGHPDYAVHPDGPRNMYTSITHIEPFGGRNLRAFGFDMYSEPVRRAAMERARDSGLAALSGKVVLVQEGVNHAGAGATQAGTLMYLPVYRAGQLAGTVEQRRKAIVGWVYAPFRMHDLMRGWAAPTRPTSTSRSTTASRPAARPCCTARPMPRPTRGACAPAPRSFPAGAPGPSRCAPAPPSRTASTPRVHAWWRSPASA